MSPANGPAAGASSRSHTPLLDTCSLLSYPSTKWPLLLKSQRRESSSPTVSSRPSLASSCESCFCSGPYHTLEFALFGIDISKHRHLWIGGEFNPILKQTRTRAAGHKANLSTRELAEEGYSGCEVRVTHARTEIIIRATHTQEVLGDKGRRIRELKALVEKRFKFPEGALELYAEKVQYRGLSAVAQAESLRYKLLGGLAMRRYVTLCFILVTS